MPTLTIRNVSPEIRDHLREMAAAHGNSMEAEVRDILVQTVKFSRTRPGEVARRIHERFAAIGGADDLPLPEDIPLSGPVNLAR